MGPKKKTRKPRKNKPYSAGQMNKLIDDFVHPLYEDSQWIRVVDGILHGLVERNVRVSAKNSSDTTCQKLLRKFWKNYDLEMGPLGLP
jgi:hypothetical protein